LPRSSSLEYWAFELKELNNRIEKRHNIASLKLRY